MKRLKAFLHYWFFGCLEAPKHEITPTEAYQAGFLNGEACGVLKGRSAAIDELEVIVRASGKAMADADDVALLKQRTLH